MIRISRNRLNLLGFGLFTAFVACQRPGSGGTLDAKETSPADAGFPFELDGGVSLTLCGPTFPCQLKNTETLDEELRFRNGAPDVAVDETGQIAVLHSHATGGFTGLLSQKAPQATEWSTQELPFPVATGTLLRSAPLTMLVDDGTTAPSRLKEKTASGTWASVPGFPDVRAVNARTAFYDDTGCLHFAGLAATTYDVGMYARHCGGGWDTHLWSDNRGIINTGRLIRGKGPEGVALLYPAADAVTQQSELRYVRIGTLPPEQWQHERAATYKDASILYEPTPLVAVATEFNQPHIFYSELSATTAPPSSSLALKAASLNEQNSWQSNTLFENTGRPFDCRPPRFEGETCEFSSIEHMPLAAVASTSTDSLRLLVARKTQTASLVATREEGSFELTWKGSFLQDGALWVVWKEGSTSTGEPMYQHQEVAASGFYASSGSAVVDGEGNIHLVAYTMPRQTDYAQNPGNLFGVTYVMLSR